MKTGNDEGERDETPNSKKLRQVDLERLYTGPQIQAGEKFAQMLNALTICLTYSAGIPLMYFIMVIFFVVAYWFNKMMLMRYYQITFEFSEVMPMKAILYLKYGILLHILVSIWMFSNPSLLQHQESSMEHFLFYSSLDEIDDQDTVLQLHSQIMIGFYGFVLFLFLFDKCVYSFIDQATSGIVGCVAGCLCIQEEKVIGMKEEDQFEGGDLLSRVREVKNKHTKADIKAVDYSAQRATLQQLMSSKKPNATPKLEEDESDWGASEDYERDEQVQGQKKQKTWASKMGKDEES